MPGEHGISVGHHPVGEIFGEVACPDAASGAEESEEFPLALGSCNQDERKTMGSRVLAAEVIAPTHPHPSKGRLDAGAVRDGTDRVGQGPPSAGPVASHPPGIRSENGHGPHKRSVPSRTSDHATAHQAGECSSIGAIGGRLQRLGAPSGCQGSGRLSPATWAARRFYEGGSREVVHSKAASAERGEL